MLTSQEATTCAHSKHRKGYIRPIMMANVGLALKQGKDINTGIKYLNHLCLSGSINYCITVNRKQGFAV